MMGALVTFLVMLMLGPGVLSVTDSESDSPGCAKVGSVVIYTRMADGKFAPMLTMPVNQPCVIPGTCSEAVGDAAGGSTVLPPFHPQPIWLNTTAYYAVNSLEANEFAMLVPMQSAVEDNEDFANKGCEGEHLTQPDPGVRWVALLERGMCKFDQKLKYALLHNASAVIIFNNRNSTLETMSHQEYGVVSVMVDKAFGYNVAHLMSYLNETGQGHNVYVNITYLGQQCSNAERSDNPRTPVMAVGLTFVVLMIIGLGWLVYYYIWRHRNLNKNSKRQERLEKAARKALRLLGERIISAADEEARAGYPFDCTYCLDGFRVGDVIRDLPCRHKFHKSCVDTWLIENRTCPNCKENIIVGLGMKVKGVKELDCKPEQVVELHEVELPEEGQFLVAAPDGAQLVVEAPDGSQYFTSSHSIVAGSQVLSGSQLLGRSQVVSADGQSYLILSPPNMPSTSGSSRVAASPRMFDGDDDAESTESEDSTSRAQTTPLVKVTQEKATLLAGSARSLSHEQR